MVDNEPRCDCGSLFEICNYPNCPLGDSHPDPQDRWEGWPGPPPSVKSRPDREGGWSAERSLVLPSREGK